jgi:NAD(P)-dependent dehydrogenase (short-subunit alcohol dehydrogenase family)
MDVTYRLDGWNALVTGSTKGIGLATARLLAASGARVIVHGSDALRCETVAHGITRAVPIAADLADPQARDALCDQVMAACGARLDILVHNAGIYPQGTIDTQSLDEYRRVQVVNVEAVFHITKRLLPALVAAAYPSVVVVSSVVFRMREGADSPAYGASKAAQIGLTRHLAAELGPRGIRVNCVLPGLVDTPGTRAERVTDESYEQFAHDGQMLDYRIQPDDIAQGIVFLCSPAARAITAASLDINAGSSVGG